MPLGRRTRSPYHKPQGKDEQGGQADIYGSGKAPFFCGFTNDSSRRNTGKGEELAYVPREAKS
jgi:hypothetical protein